MKRGIRTSIVALALIVGAVALAQAEDDFLQRYELARESLSEAVTAMPEAGSVAREAVDQAVGTLRTLARETESAALVSAMERVFERAREAIANQSRVDLEVQVNVLRGGFERLVYDAALRSAVAGDLERARTRLQAVAADVGVPEATMTVLGDADRTIVEHRYALEAGVASRIQDLLGQAEQQAAAEVGSAYPLLARAYGHYLIVQDSPRAAADINPTFINAASALVEGQTDTVLQDLETLRSRFASLEESAGSALGEASGQAAAQPEPAELPATQPQTQAPAEAEAPAETEAPADAAADGAATGAAEAPAADAAQEDVADAEAQPDATGAPAEGEELTDPSADEGAMTPEEIARRVAEEIAAEQRAQQIAALDRELASAGVAESRRAELAARIVDEGHTSLGSVIRDLYADAAQAAGAISRGRPEAARGFVSAYAERYRRSLAPILATTAPELDLRTTALTNRIVTAEGLRLQDVVVLSSHAGALQEALTGGTPSLAHAAAVDTVRFWAGMVRLIAVLVLGVLAFVPLYLLNLAFGGGNRNWRLVGVALFFLLIPVVYEALAFIADLIAAATGIETLYAVAQYSMFHNPISQVAWAALTALAILFAIGGLYGICVQFGLIGRGRTTRTAETQVRETVDWDEEF